MSTKRKLRRTMRALHELDKLQKPLCKIADLPEEDRQFVRDLIRCWAERANLQRITRGSLDAAAQCAEKLINNGLLKIIIDQPPGSSVNPEDIQFTIVRTGLY